MGSFPGQRWAEWNSRFRDDVRRFWRGDPGMTGAFASRLCGSADLYQRSGKAPVNSINFIACHDGFTLNDLVSYSRKWNERNGEDGRDGADENYSANHGVEGPSDDPAIEALRLRQIKNMLATLFVSRGVPVLLGGDEFRRTQGGNSNAYCQDNETSWYDWRLLGRNAETFAFCRQMIALRSRCPEFHTDAFYTGAQIRWFGADGAAPDWAGPMGVLGCAIAPVDGSADDGTLSLCLLFNATGTSVRFVLPQAGDGRRWSVLVDTSRSLGRPADDTAYRTGTDALVAFTLEAHSMAILGVAPSERDGEFFSSMHNGTSVTRTEKDLTLRRHRCHPRGPARDGRRPRHADLLARVRGAPRPGAGSGARRAQSFSTALA